MSDPRSCTATSSDPAALHLHDFPPLGAMPRAVHDRCASTPTLNQRGIQA
jgi:hypothetical protein